jgi:hypothetical protein
MSVFCLGRVSSKLETIYKLLSLQYYTIVQFRDWSTLIIQKYKNTEYFPFTRETKSTAAKIISSRNATVFPKNAKNARKSQNTPSTNPYQNETQFSPLSLKSGVSRHPRQPKSVICPPVISGTNSRASSLKFP